MSIIIDLIILAIILLCVILGYKKGLTKCIIKILSFVIALAVAFVLFKPISTLIIKNTTIDDNIRNSIINLVQDDVEENGKISEESNLPQSMIEHINESIQNSVNETKMTVVNTVATEISVGVVNVCVAIGLFIIARIALIFVSALSSIITDLPLIKQFDKAGGLIYGLVKSLLIIFIIFAIISFISPMIESSGIIEAINKSIVGSVLYNNNLLLKIVL
ncbi:MAG: hypothetical protein HFJ41_03340 [Clostridia bacterium]|nr:hypothetical protein [Clostridia bacterium]